MPEPRTKLFTVPEREALRGRILELARTDARLIAAADVGSLAGDAADRYSDIDLTFAVAAGSSVDDVLADWTSRMAQNFDALHLADTRRGSSVYRVFLLPGALQCDLSFAPEAEFGALGPQFRLLYGQAVPRPPLPAVDPRHLFGWAVHHALRARFSIERGQLWRAEYWLSGMRDEALSIACLRAGLPAAYGRGYDQLPPDLLDRCSGALARSLDRAELLRALKSAVECLLEVSPPEIELAGRVAPQLRALAEPF